MTSPTIPILKMISGFEPDKFDTYTLIIRRGHCSSSNGTKFAAMTDDRKLILSNNGPNGLDQGSPVNGADYFVYIIKDEVNDIVAPIASQSITYGGVLVPTGWTMYRKLRFGFVFNIARDGIPNFHLSHWPMPHVRLTDAETSGAYMPLVNSSSTAFIDVSLTGWLPDNARLAYIGTNTTSTTTAGSAYIRSYSGQTSGVLVGSASPTNLGERNFLTIRVSSTRQLQFKTTGGARLSIYVLGYDMTEPS